MPVYEYECATNKHRFERTQRFSDPPVEECPECGSTVRRVIFPAGIVFKGSGWYITDSRSTPSEGSASSASGGTAAKGDSKSEGTGTKAEGAKTEGGGAAASKSDSAGTPAKSASS